MNNRTSEVAGLYRQGQLDRSAGIKFFDNPIATDVQVVVKTQEQLDAWCDMGAAWMAGWLSEDAGRDQAVAGLQRLRWW